MTPETTALFATVAATVAELSALETKPEGPQPLSMRELFLELAAISLGNLYGKTPIANQLYDRGMLKPIAEGLDDNEISKLTLRTEDWFRLEGIVRATEGQKAYTLNRLSFAVLSTATPDGMLGEVMERVCRCYTAQSATPALRQRARELAAYFMTRIERS